MENEVKENSKPLLQKLGEGILKAQQEIDELALQLSLGKSEAKDKFEELKKEFTQNVNEVKNFIKSKVDKSLPASLQLRLDELELRLKVGKAETQETFEVQRSALVEATIALENEIREALEKIQVPNHFQHEVEKFLLKLEILRLKFGVKRFEIRDAFRARMSRAEKSIQRFIEKAGKLGSKRSSSDFKKEIAEAYKHLKSAVKNL
jgi:hypothetical protein